MDGSHCPQFSQISTATLSAMVDKTTRMRKDAKITPENMPKNPEEHSRTVVPYSFEDYRSGKLPPSYAEPLMSIDYVRYFIIFSRRQSVFLRELGADEKHKYVVWLLCSATIRDSHCGNAFCHEK